MSLSMNGHLRRCRFGIPPHVRLSTLRGDSSLRLASDAFLNRLQHLMNRAGS